MKKKGKVIIIGWDCAAPDIVFNKLKGELKNVNRIMEGGVWGKLHSVYPPITVPAWHCMFTGKSPGDLGLYGFRARKNKSYKDFSIVNSKSITYPAIWDIAGNNDMKSIVSNVPPTYPPREIKGKMISCFLTPGTDSTWTYPAKLAKKIKKIAPDYTFDTVFRTENKQLIKDACFKMTEDHFKVLEQLLKKKSWNLAVHVEIGLDRIHHGFWKYFDETHHLYEKDSVYKDVIKDYYVLIDRWLGRIMDKADEDTLIIVVSDHGAKRMKGCFCVNQWLEKIGYLKFKTAPEFNQKITKADIDWENTKAWAWGGYYSRIFFNVKGREEQGIIEPADFEKTRAELKKEVIKVSGPNGEKMDNKAFTPDELYDNPAGEKPDLMVFWDDLYWRSAGTLGHDSIFLEENDTGPDDAVHDWNGVFMGWKKKWNKGEEIEGKNLLDILPTLLEYYGIPGREQYKGNTIKEVLD